MKACWRSGGRSWTFGILAAVFSVAYLFNALPVPGTGFVGDWLAGRIVDWKLGVRARIPSFTLSFGAARNLLTWKNIRYALSSGATFAGPWLLMLATSSAMLAFFLPALLPGTMACRSGRERIDADRKARSGKGR